MTTTERAAASDAGTGSQAGFLAHGDLAVRNGDRIIAHATAESTNDIDAVMTTLTPAPSLTWSGGYSWAAPTLAPDGQVKATVNTEPDGIRGFYLSSRRRYDVTSIGIPYIRHSSDWYAIIESDAHFESRPERHPYQQRWVLLSPMDGEEGITGEIAWGLFPQLQPTAEITEDARQATFGRYVDALRRSDLDALAALHAPGAQGAVRDYSGGPTSFRHLDGAAELAEHHARFFETFRVTEVDPILIVDRAWYLFTELRWRVEVLRGPDAGRSGTLRTAEIIPLDAGGRLYGHLGFGTAVL